MNLDHLYSTDTDERLACRDCMRLWNFFFAWAAIRWVQRRRDRRRNGD